LIQKTGSGYHLVGYAQGLEDEWGYLSQAEIERPSPSALEILKKNWPYAGSKKN
jgi:hypothetical protein